MIVEITLRVNGEPTTITTDTRESLLDLLREHLQLTVMAAQMVERA